MFELNIREGEIKGIAYKSACEFGKIIKPFHISLGTFLDIKNNDNN